MNVSKVSSSIFPSHVSGELTRELDRNSLAPNSRANSTTRFHFKPLPNFLSKKSLRLETIRLVSWMKLTQISLLPSSPNLENHNAIAIVSPSTRRGDYQNSRHPLTRIDGASNFRKLRGNGWPRC